MQSLYSENNKMGKYEWNTCIRNYLGRELRARRMQHSAFVSYCTQAWFRGRAGTGLWANGISNVSVTEDLICCETSSLQLYQINLSSAARQKAQTVNYSLKLCVCTLCTHCVYLQQRGSSKTQVTLGIFQYILVVHVNKISECSSTCGFTEAAAYSLQLFVLQHDVSDLSDYKLSTRKESCFLVHCDDDPSQWIL